MSVLLYILLCTFSCFDLMTAYSQQIMYEELFTSSEGWTFGGTYTFPSTNALCFNTTSCLELGNNDGWAEKTWSFTGYQNIEFQFDVVSNGASGQFNFNYFYQSLSSYGQGGPYAPTPTRFTKDGGSFWNNQDWFRLRLRMTGNDIGVKIYVSNFRWYGTPYPTVSPTKQPTTTPIILTGSPHPTYNPTSIPTSYPTINPTILPTSNPTTIPTSYPTINPTFNPIIDPTKHPTSIPTSNPTKTSHPTTVPTYNPTKTPTTIRVTTKSPTKVPITELTTPMTTLAPTPIETTLLTYDVDGNENQNSKIDNSGNSKELIIWILIIVAGLISFGTMIGCAIVIRLFCKNIKKSEQLSSSNAYGEGNQNNSSMMINNDSGKQQHIQHNLSFPSDIDIVTQTEVEMAMGGVAGTETVSMPQQRNKPKYTDAFSDSESRSNSDMYIAQNNASDVVTPTNNTADGDADMQTSPGLP